MIRKLFIFLIVVFIVLQFFRPAKNQSNELLPSDITNVTVVPDSVLHLLKIACYDCHSNNTRYPWYNNIQPVYWWMNNHIQDGKKRLNFSTFGDYGLKKAAKKMKGIAKVIEKDEMPLPSYTLIHRDAILNDHQKSLILNWAKKCCPDRD
ncbi:MAG: cytochrome [Bacteroidota bacterium]|nr:cytochrome [Bacteroidota bacterium]